MKEKIQITVLSLFISVVVSVFMYVCWYLGKKVSYELFYEDQVIQTIEEYMQEREASQ